jgi:hypothetical protein
LDRDTRQRNSLKIQANELDQKLPPIQLKGKDEINPHGRKSIHNSQPEIDLNFLFDKIDRLSSHVSHNDQRLLQLEQALSSHQSGSKVRSFILLSFLTSPQIIDSNGNIEAQGILRESRKLKSKVEDLQNILASEIKSRHLSEETFIKQIEFLTLTQSQHQHQSRVGTNQDDLFSAQALVTRLDKLSDQLRVVEDAMDRDRGTLSSRQQQLSQSFETQNQNLDNLLQKYQLLMATVEGIEGILPSLSSMDSTLLEKMKKEESTHQQHTQQLSDELHSLKEKIQQMEENSQQRSVDSVQTMKANQAHLLDVVDDRINDLLVSHETTLKRFESKSQQFYDRLETHINKDQESNLISSTEIREILSAEITSRRTVVSKLTQQVNVLEEIQHRSSGEAHQLHVDYEQKFFHLDTSLNKVTQNLTEQLMTLQNNIKTALQSLQMKQIKSENLMIEFGMKVQSMESEIQMISHALVTTETKFLSRLHQSMEELKVMMEGEKSVQEMNWKRSLEMTEVHLQKKIKEDYLVLIDEGKQEVSEEILMRNQKEQKELRREIERRFHDLNESLQSEEKERREECEQLQLDQKGLKKEFLEQVERRFREVKGSVQTEEKERREESQQLKLDLNELKRELLEQAETLTDNLNRRGMELDAAVSKVLLSLKESQGANLKQYHDLESQLNDFEKTYLIESQRRDEEHALVLNQCSDLNQTIENVNHSLLSFQGDEDLQKVILSVEENKFQMTRLTSQLETLGMEFQFLKSQQVEMQNLEVVSSGKEEHNDLLRVIRDEMREFKGEMDGNVKKVKQQLIGSRSCLKHLQDVVIGGREDQSTPVEVLFALDDMVLEVIDRQASLGHSFATTTVTKTSQPSESLAKIYSELNHLKTSLTHLGKNWEHEHEITRKKLKDIDKNRESSQAVAVATATSHSTTAAASATATAAATHGLVTHLLHQQEQRTKELEKKIELQHTTLNDTIVQDVLSELVENIAQNELISVIDSSFENMKSEFHFKILNRLQTINQSMSEVQKKQQVIEEKISKYDMVLVSTRMRDLEKSLQDLSIDLENLKSNN